MLGLAGEVPDTIDPDNADAIVAEARNLQRLDLAGRHPIRFDAMTDIVFDGVSDTPKHPNTLAFRAYDADGALIAEERWCSIGGGFIVPEAEVGQPTPPAAASVPYPFRNARELLAMAERAGLTIADLVMANERAQRPAEEVVAHLDRVVGAMMSCLDRGISTEGELPGGLMVKPPRQGDPRPAARPQRSLAARDHGLGEPLRHCGERGERRRRARRHRADQWRGRRGAGDAALLSRPHARRLARGHARASCSPRAPSARCSR